MAMASDGVSKCSKKMTISFTLPISCQICLGKVKQPVLCSNLHVFCSLCLEIWLNRNSQCPACRVDIGPNNPVRHIIGGQVEDEDCEKKSTPEFRRARFDLLYHEYEDQVEQMKKENIILTTENNILIAQLKELEEKNNKNKEEQVPSLSTHSLEISDGPSLLMLTKKLQEAQRLYSTIKAHMSELKQENCKLKDENIHLTRENETLRLEIAQRSPKKFGRYTVATLETKIAEQEREIRQLKKALECSDSFIEELQRRQEKRHDKEGERKLEVQTSLANKAKFNINLEPNNFAGENCSSKNTMPQKNKHCKVLFGNVVHEDGSHTSKKIDVSSTEISSTSSHKLFNLAKTTSKISEDSAKTDTEPVFIQSNSNTRTMAQTFKQTDAHTIPHRNPDSLMESGLRVSEPEFPVKDTDNGTILQRNPKKVHFNISKLSGDGSSFDLEVPSPASLSSISNSRSSTDRELKSLPHNSLTQADFSPKIDSQDNIDIPNSNFEGNAHNLTSKETMSFKSKLSTVDISYHPHTSGTSKKSKQIQGNVKRIKSSTISTSADQDSENVNDSCHLSIPDITMEEMVDNLSDNNVSELDDNDDDGFDTSMTPELTYCLKLMNQAEKKINLPVSKASSTQELPISGVSVPISSNSKLPVYQAPHPSCPPHTITDIHKFPPQLHYLPVTTKNDHHQFAPSSSSIPSRWEQQFYNSLKVNPYKYTTTSKPYDFYMGVNNRHNKNEASIENIQEIQSLPDFKFSDPLKVSLTSSNKPFNPPTLTGHSNFHSHINLFNPASIYQNVTNTSVTSSSIPAASSGYNFTPFTSKAYNIDSNLPASLSSLSELGTAKAQTPNSTSSFSSSLLELPTSSSQCGHNIDHALSASLSNSELEWPENS